MGTLQSAIEGCVKECLDSPTPFLCVSGYCDRLRDDGAFTPEEIDDIGVQAWRTLRRILDQ